MGKSGKKIIFDWLSHQEQEKRYIFRLVYITEKNDPTDELVNFLQSSIITSYRTIKLLKFHLDGDSESEIRQYVKNNIIPSDNTQTDRNVRQGDWGEILAALIVSHFQNLVVPTNKLQWKVNKDKAVFGTDLIAYNSGDQIRDIYYYEVKTRLSPQNKEGKKPDRNYITIIAHNTLLKDENAPTEIIADFLERLYVSKSELDEAKKFKDIVKNPQKYKKNFELFFVLEKKNFGEFILEELNDLPPQLNPLNVTIVFIDDLKKLIDNTWKDIEDSLVTLLG